MAIYGEKNVLGVQESGYINREKLGKVLDDLFPASSNPNPADPSKTLPTNPGDRFAIQVSRSFENSTPSTLQNSKFCMTEGNFVELS